MTMNMNQAKAIATVMTDPHNPDFDPIDFHNVAGTSEAITVLNSSRVAENRVLGRDLFIALNFYHIGRGNR